MQLRCVAVQVFLIVSYSTVESCYPYCCLPRVSSTGLLLSALQDFVGILAAFSKRASRDDKVRFIFTVFDMDGDGHVGAEDLDLILRQLAGRCLRSDLWTSTARAGQGTGAPCKIWQTQQAVDLQKILMPATSAPIHWLLVS